MEEDFRCQVFVFPYCFSPSQKDLGACAVYLILQMGVHETERETDSVFGLGALRSHAKSLISISFFSPVVSFLCSHSPMTPPDLSATLPTSCFLVASQANINFLFLLLSQSTSLCQQGQMECVMVIITNQHLCRDSKTTSKLEVKGRTKVIKQLLFW